jgi:hypothetical protein
MNKLFVISPVLSMFMPGGMLRPFLHTCAAAIIAAHERFVNNFTYSNGLVSKVKNTADILKLSCGDAKGEQVIFKWGKIINDDFRKRNHVHFETQVPHDANMLNMMMGLLYQMKEKVDGMKETVDRLKEQDVLRDGTMNEMMAEMRSLKRSGNDVPRRSNKHARREDEELEDQEVDQRLSPAPANGSLPETGEAYAQRTPPELTILHHGADAERQLAKLEVHVVVEDFYRYRRLHKDAQMNHYFPPYAASSEGKAKFKHVVGTLHGIMTEPGFYEDTHDFSKDADLPEVQLFNLSNSLQNDLRRRAVYRKAKQEGKKKVKWKRISKSREEQVLQSWG